MNAGELRDRITIERRVEVRDADTGDITFTWGTYLQRWAKVVPDGGGEPMELNRQLTRNRYKVFMRHASTVNGTDRIKWMNRTLNIENIAEARDGDLGIWVATATEGIA